MSEETEYETAREETEARFLAAYTAWYTGATDGRTARASFLSAAFDLGRLMYDTREGGSDE